MHIKMCLGLAIMQLMKKVLFPAFFYNITFRENQKLSEKVTVLILKATDFEIQPIKYDVYLICIKMANF